MKKQQTRTTTLTLHNLLVALSFWGTTVRAMLFAFLALFAFAISLSAAETGAASALASEIMVLTYALGSFVLLDFGYVMIARTYGLQKGLDVFALLVSEIILALLYLIPSVVVTNALAAAKTNPMVYIVFVPIVALTLRMLLGMLFGQKRR